MNTTTGQSNHVMRKFWGFGVDILKSGGAKVGDVMNGLPNLSLLVSAIGVLGLTQGGH